MHFNKKALFSEKFQLSLAVLAIILVFSPYFYLGEDVHVKDHDNLDSTIVWLKMVVDQFGLSPSLSIDVDQMMGGVPRSAVWSTYDIPYLLTYLLGTYWGYVISKLLMSLIGFLGMQLLLKKYCLPKDSPIYLSIATALLFAILPLWSIGATVSGAPLVIFAFLNLRNKQTDWYNWFILIIYAFDSSLILLGIFILLFITILFIADVIKSRKINWHLFAGLFLLSIMYVISHFPLFYSFLVSSDFESVRKSFIFGFGITRQVVFYQFWNMLLFSDDTDWSFIPSKQAYVIISTVLFSCILFIKNREFNKLYVYLICIIVFTSLFVSLWDFYMFIPWRSEFLKFIPLDLRRISWIQPTCWYILFALSLYAIHKYIPKSYWLILIVVSLQFGIILKSQEYIFYSDKPTYRQFYAEKQFEDIKKTIGKDPKSYRVISLGLHASISQYNGFYTVDGFSINYPLAYKYKFRRIIEAELKKNATVKRFYDGWGGWCYAYWGNFEIKDLQICQNKYSKIEHLDFNYDALKEMGGEYIISAAEINADNNKRLQLLKVFDNYPDSHWTIYLYKVL